MREYPVMPVMVTALKKSRATKELVHVILRGKSLTTHLQGKLEHSCKQTDKEIKRFSKTTHLGNVNKGHSTILRGLT